MLSIRTLKVWYGTTEILAGCLRRCRGRSRGRAARRQRCGQDHAAARPQRHRQAAQWQIEFDGGSIAGLSPRSIVRRGLVQVPQGRVRLARHDVLRQSALGAVTRHDKAEIHASIDDAFALFPTLHRRQADRAGQLSGGEQQMLAIARALMAGRACCCWTSPRPDCRPASSGKWWRRCAPCIIAAWRCCWWNRMSVWPVRWRQGLCARQWCDRLRNGWRQPGVQSADHPSYLGQ